MADEEGLPISYYEGHPFPSEMFLPRETLVSAINYKPHDGDIVVCGFPRTGTIWTSFIVNQILHDTDLVPNILELISEKFPVMERSGTKMLDALPHPRAYLTSLSGRFMKINDRAKYIYLHRNPSDALVSFYHANEQLRSSTYNLDLFFDQYIEGKVPHGSIFDHVLSVNTHKNSDYFLFVQFEDLRKDTRSQVLKIAEFLGEEYHKRLTEDEERLSKLLELIDFERLSDSLSAKENQVRADGGGGDKVLKPLGNGLIGEGKKTLSKEQLQKIKAKIHEKMEGTEFVDLWA